MSRTCAVTRASSDSLERLEQTGALSFQRCRHVNLQRGRCWCSLRKRKHIEQEMLEWKHLERTFVHRRPLKFAESHLRGQLQVTQHAGAIHAAPAARGGC